MGRCLTCANVAHRATPCPAKNKARQGRKLRCLNCREEGHTTYDPEELCRDPRVVQWREIKAAWREIGWGCLWLAAELLIEELGYSGAQPERTNAVEDSCEKADSQDSDSDLDGSLSQSLDSDAKFWAAKARALKTAEFVPTNKQSTQAARGKRKAEVYDDDAFHPTANKRRQVSLLTVKFKLK